jgi:hypothetical protein
MVPSMLFYFFCTYAVEEEHGDSRQRKSWSAENRHNFEGEAYKKKNHNLNKKQ